MDSHSEAWSASSWQGGVVDTLHNWRARPTARAKSGTQMSTAVLHRESTTEQPRAEEQRKREARAEDEVKTTEMPMENQPLAPARTHGPSVVEFPQSVSPHPMTAHGPLPRGTADLEFRLVDWVVRVVQILTEPLRVMGHWLLHGVQEPRYSGARHGVVMVRRSRHHGGGTTLLWNVPRGTYGAFTWADPEGRRELAQSLLSDFLEGGVPPALCAEFAEKAFPKVPSGCRWTLTTRQIEQILLTCVDDAHADGVAAS